MPPSAAELGPARLRLLATAAKREALALASEWGTPLAPIPGVLTEAFQSPLGEAAGHAIRGWECDLNDLGNCLFRLCSACEAAADEEEAIARAVAGGFPSPNRCQDVAAAFLAWDRRNRQQRPFIAPTGSGGGLVAIDPGRVRQAAQGLLDAGGEFDAGYQRLTGPFRDVGLEPPEELRWVVEGCQRLAAELRKRADAFEAADAEVRQAAASALTGVFSGLLAPVAAALSSMKTGSGGEPHRRAAADAKRLMEELRPSGVFDLAHFDKGRKLLAEAERASRDDPRYAAVFLRALGPANLRWLIEQGQLDPCVLGALVTRASHAGIGTDFLKKTLGTDRFDAPRRAALLSACPCPTALFDPTWVDRMTVTLLTGRDPPGKGTPGSGTDKPPRTSSPPTPPAPSSSSTATSSAPAAPCSLTTTKVAGRPKPPWTTCSSTRPRAWRRPPRTPSNASSTAPPSMSSAPKANGPCPGCWPSREPSAPSRCS